MASLETKPHGNTTMVENGFDTTYDLDEKAKFSDYKTDAIEAENEEHSMTVMDAVKAYPMATFWAFVMSATIVSSLPAFPLCSSNMSLTTLPDYGVL